LSELPFWKKIIIATAETILHQEEWQGDSCCAGRARAIVSSWFGFGVGYLGKTPENLAGKIISL